MTSEKRITCIVCPLGCKIWVKTKGTTCEILSGNKCKKGVNYARHEALDPRRMLTTSVLVTDGEWPLVSIKSSQPVPKEQLFLILRELKKTTLKAPIQSGALVLKNVANTNINIIATRTVKNVEK